METDETSSDTIAELTIEQCTSRAEVMDFIKGFFTDEYLMRHNIPERHVENALGTFNDLLKEGMWKDPLQIKSLLEILLAKINNLCKNEHILEGVRANFENDFTRYFQLEIAALDEEEEDPVYELYPRAIPQSHEQRQQQALTAASDLGEAIQQETTMVVDTNALTLQFRNALWDLNLPLSRIDHIAPDVAFDLFLKMPTDPNNGKVFPPQRDSLIEIPQNRDPIIPAAMMAHDAAVQLKLDVMNALTTAHISTSKTRVKSFLLSAVAAGKVGLVKVLSLFQWVFHLVYHKSRTDSMPTVK